MASRNLTIWTPDKGEFVLTAQVLNEIMGGDAGGYVQTPIATAGNGTLTAAAVLGGQIARTGPVAAFTDTTDTAANLVAGLGGFQAGQAFLFMVKNGTAFVQTLAGGTGVTLPAAILVPPFSAGWYFGTVGGTAAAPTVAVAHITTGPINVAAAVAAPQALALNTVGAGTITAAGFNAGITTRGGTQIAAFADTTDTAANLVAGLSAISTTDGTSAEWTYVNNTIFPATLGGGTGVTISGQTVVPANSWARYLASRTSATAVVLTCVGQGFFPKIGTTPAANGATPVAVTDAAVTANSTIALTLKTAAGTPHGAFVSSVTPGTGFSINSLAGDTSTYTYEIRG
jgi:hypothetical protein